MKMKPIALAAALVGLPLILAGLASSQEPRPKPAPTPVVGERAPAFQLNDHTGRGTELPIGDEESWTVLAFFPKAATPG